MLPAPIFGRTAELNMSEPCTWERKARRYSSNRERDGLQRLKTQRRWALKKNMPFRFGATLLLVGLALFSIASATLILAAPGSLAAGEVTVDPSQVYTGDTIEISLKGFPGDYPVPAGAMTLGGIRLPIPGVFGAPGVTPRTDSLGDVTFTVQVPSNVPLGDQTLTVTQFAGDGERTAAVTILAAEVSFSSGATSPNQPAVIRGSGFTPASRSGGKGTLGVHQISGEGASGITVNGLLLKAPHVTYPVDLDSDGRLTATLTMPEDYATFPGGTLEVKVIDDAGRAGVGVWIIRPRKISLSPAKIGRGGKVKVTGSGFLATDRSSTRCMAVDIAYAGTILRRVYSDSTGAFTTTITVPMTPGPSRLATQFRRPYPAVRPRRQRPPLTKCPRGN